MEAASKRAYYNRSVAADEVKLQTFSREDALCCNMSSLLDIGYAAIVLLVMVGSILAFVAKTKDTVGGYGTKGDTVLAAAVLGFAIATIGTSVL